MTTDGPILLVGGGKMGGALATGWLAAGIEPGQIHIVEPDPARRAALAELGLGTSYAEAGVLPPGLQPRVLLMAVKPQMMATAAPPLRPVVTPACLVLSIAAGTPIAAFEGWFGSTTPIIRAMPNTPAAVGRGATVCCANGASSAADRQLAETLLRAVGIVRWVPEEQLMHAVTALSGSGPAYVFLLIEAMAEAGVALGLPAELATELARETVAGAGELVRRSAEPAAVLRRNVTSPGGTTQAALDVLMAEDGLSDLMSRALEAAARRSRELA
jgi:pyrroline-5-carboxylate reductase